MKVTKAWVGPKGTLPSPCTCSLTGVDTGKTLTLNERPTTGRARSQTCSKYDQTDTHEITSHGQEDDCPTTTVTPREMPQGGFTITNTNTEKVSVPVEKKWDDGDNQDGKRPPPSPCTCSPTGSIPARR